MMDIDLAWVLNFTLTVSPALDLGHEGSARVSLAGVLAAVVVAGADHLVVDDHVDALPAVPPLALAVLDHRHVHNLKIEASFNLPPSKSYRGAIYR